MRPKPGRHRDVVALFERRGILERSLAMPGCLGVELGLLAPDGGEILATALWSSPEAYRGWLESGGRADDVEELLTMLEGGAEGLSGTQVFDLALSAAANSGD